MIIGTVTGRLSRAKEHQGEKYTSYTFAISDRTRSKDGKEWITRYINCRAFGKVGETALTMKDGCVVFASGEMDVYLYDTKDGETRPDIIMRVNTLIEVPKEYTERNEDAGEESPTTQQEQTESREPPKRNPFR